MKRSGSIKRTGSLKRTSMKRSAPMERVRAVIPPVSTKRKKLNAERAKVIADLRSRTRYCQANPLLRAAYDRMTTDAGRLPYLRGLQACRLYGPLVGHEPKKRSRRGSIVDPAGILMTCEPCNSWVEEWPAAATEAGLLIPSSFEKDRANGR